MSLATVDITIRLNEQDGDPVANAEVVVTLNATDRTPLGSVAPITQTFYTDEDGLAVMALVPNSAGLNGTKYLVTATHPESGKKIYNKKEFTVLSEDAYLDTLFGDSPVATEAYIEQALDTFQGYHSDMMALADDITAVSTISANIVTVAGIAANVTTVATNNANVTTVAGISGNVTTVAGISGNVTTVAGISANVTTVAGAAANIATIVANLTNINTLAPISAAIVTVAGLDDEVAALAAIAVPIVAVYANLDEIATVNSGATQIVGVYNALSAVNTVSSAIAAVNTVAGISANVTSVAGNAVNINAVAAALANINTVAGIAAEVSTVASNNANISIVAGNSENVSTLADAITAVNTVAGISANVTTVAGNSANVSTVAGISANVTTVAGVAASVPTVAGIAANVTTVAGISASVTTVATNNASVTTVATNMSSVLAVPALATQVAADKITVGLYEDAAANSASAAAASALIAADPNSYVAAVSKTYNLPNIKAVALYTGEDSNGWELRANLPYNNETVPAGSYKGQYANVTAAVTDGGLVEDWFYNTTDFYFYKITATGTPAASRIYRAGSKHLPLARAAVVSGSGSDCRLIIFDLTNSGCSMWMEATAVAGSPFTTVLDTTGFTVNRLHWAASELYISAGSANGRGLKVWSFASNKAFLITNTGTYQHSKGIEARNSLSALALLSAANALPDPENRTVTSYRAPNAPLHPITGMPVEIILGGGVAGAYVIYPDGTIVDWYNNLGTCSQILALPGGKGFWVVGGGGVSYICLYSKKLPTADVDKTFADFQFNNASTPARPGTDGSSGSVGEVILGAHSGSIVLPALAADERLALLNIDPETPANSMVAYVSDVSNTGWLVKPLCAAICDTLTGSVADTELLTQLSTYADQAAATAGGWTFGPNFTFDAANDEIDMGAGATHGENNFFTVTGLTANHWYRVGYTIQNWVGGGITPYTNTGAAAESGTGAVNGGANGTHYFYFKAAGTSASLVLQANAATFGTPNLSVGSITVKRAVPDYYFGQRNHFTLHGTLTAAAITPGGIAALSGFSASNYLDSTATDFDVDGVAFSWGIFFKTSVLATQTLVDSGAAGTNERRYFYMADNGKIAFYTNPSNDSVPGVYSDGEWHSAMVTCDSSGNLDFWVDGEFIKTVAYTVGAFTYGGVRIGYSTVDSAYPWQGSLALFHASSVELTPAQIRKWHRDGMGLIKSGSATLTDRVTSSSYDARNGVAKLLTTGDDVYQLNGLHFEAIEDVNSVTGATETAIASAGRIEAVAGNSGLRFAVEAKNLREAEPRKQYDYFDIKYEGDAARVQFPLQTSAAEVAAVAGCYPVRVTNAGDTKTEGASDDFTVKNDGFNNWVTFAVAPGSGNDVVVTWRREVYR